MSSYIKIKETDQVQTQTSLFKMHSLFGMLLNALIIFKNYFYNFPQDLLVPNGCLRYILQDLSDLREEYLNNVVKKIREIVFH